MRGQLQFPEFGSAGENAPYALHKTISLQNTSLNIWGSMSLMGAGMDQASRPLCSHLGHQDCVPCVVHHSADNSSVHDHRDEEDHHHTELTGEAKRSGSALRPEGSQLSPAPQPRPLPGMCWGQGTPLTMMMMAMDPVRMRERRSRSGKYGSFTPVTGFCSMRGAMAANSGRGRSWGKERQREVEMER